MKIQLKKDLPVPAYHNMKAGRVLNVIRTSKYGLVWYVQGDDREIPVFQSEACEVLDDTEDEAPDAGLSAAPPQSSSLHT